uniref:Uncharacterized protein n=1 Tax=Oryza glaberrima TaxID=4538 RepID=I1PUL6_ORYGL
MAVATDDDEDVEEMQGYRIGRIGSASCKEDRLDQMGSAVGTRVPSSGVGKVTIDRARRAAATDCRPGEPLRSPLMGMEAFDTAAASPSSMFSRPALFPSSGKLMESWCRKSQLRAVAHRRRP